MTKLCLPKWADAIKERLDNTTGFGFCELVKQEDKFLIVRNTSKGKKVIATVYNEQDADFFVNAISDVAALIKDFDNPLEHTDTETYIGDFEGYRIFVADKKLEKCLNWQDAMSYVDQIGYSLPTKEELNFIYEAKDQFYESEGKAFVSGNYWSSTEYSSTCAWYQFLGSGSQSYTAKTLTLYVRPIRKELCI